MNKEPDSRHGVHTNRTIAKEADQSLIALRDALIWTGIIVLALILIRVLFFSR